MNCVCFSNFVPFLECLNFKQDWKGFQRHSLCNKWQNKNSDKYLYAMINLFSRFHRNICFSARIVWNDVKSLITSHGLEIAWLKFKIQIMYHELLCKKCLCLWRKREKTRTISNFLPKIQIKRNQDLFRCASKSKIFLWPLHSVQLGDKSFVQSSD